MQRSPYKWREAPLTYRAVVIWLFFGIAFVFGLLFFGRHFYTSPKYMHLFLWPSVVACCLYGLVMISLLRKASYMDISYAVDIRKMHPILRYLLMPALMTAIFCYVPLTDGIPFVVNFFVGKTTAINTVISATHEGGKYCSDVDTPALNNYWFGTTCISFQTYEEAKPGDHITLEGRQSWFGFQVTGYRFTPQKVPVNTNIKYSENFGKKYTMLMMKKYGTSEIIYVKN